MNSVTSSNQFLRTEAKVLIYKTVVWPVLVCYAETRADAVKTTQISKDMKTLRRILILVLLERERSDVTSL